MPASEIQRQVYRDKFRSLHKEAFEAWFNQLLVALHPAGDFQPIRKTRGDGGLDGHVISEQRVYQAYAPARNAGLYDSKTAAKIRTDFAKAHSTLGGHLRAWTFVHNHPEGKLGEKSAAIVAHLTTEHPDVEVSVLDINSLWEMKRHSKTRGGVRLDIVDIRSSSRNRAHRHHSDRPSISILRIYR